MENAKSDMGERLLISTKLEAEEIIHALKTVTAEEKLKKDDKIFEEIKLMEHSPTGVELNDIKAQLYNLKTKLEEFAVKRGKKISKSLKGKKLSEINHLLNN